MRTVDETIKAVRGSLESPHTRTWAPIFYPEAEALFVEIEALRSGRAEAERAIYSRNCEIDNLKRKADSAEVQIAALKSLLAAAGDKIAAMEKSAARAFRKARRAK